MIVRQHKSFIRAVKKIPTAVQLSVLETIEAIKAEKTVGDIPHIKKMGDIKQLFVSE